MSLAPASMRYNEKMFSRQLGRNAQLFAQQLGRLETAEARYPYLRQLLAVIEEARPEWGEAEHRSALFAQLVRDLCGPAVTDEEIETAVRARDAERALATADLRVPFTPPASEASDPAGDSDPEGTIRDVSSDTPSGDTKEASVARSEAAASSGTETEDDSPARSGRTDGGAMGDAATDDAR